MRTLGKRVRQQCLRGFESLSVRHFPLPLLVNRRKLVSPFWILILSRSRNQSVRNYLGRHGSNEWDEDERQAWKEETSCSWESIPTPVKEESLRVMLPWFPRR